MTRVRIFELEGVRFVVMTQKDYEVLRRRNGKPIEDEALPRFPRPDRRGNMPAVEYGRVSIAREVIQMRRNAGLSQSALAKLAGLRQETLSRIETAKHTATPSTLERIERAIQRRTKARTSAAARA